MVPGQAPAVAPCPPFAHQEQAPLDLPNQPPAADSSQPAAAEPSTETSSALAPPDPLAAAPEEPSPSVEPAAAELRPGWCKKLQDALRHQRAAGHAILVAEDVNDIGAKRWGSFRDVAALVAHRRSIGFLTSVLNLPEDALRFQACKAHGEARPPKQGFEYGVHDVLGGFYLRGLEVRRAFGRAFGTFLENPPNDLKSSVELLRKDGGSAYMWDESIYGRHRCFRLLKSSKFGDRFRPLAPSAGSSEAIADHLIFLYSEAELAGSTEISADLLGEWASARPGPSAPARLGAFRQRALTLDEASTSEGPREDLSEQERAVLLARYRKDHAGADFVRVVQERPGVFFVHFRSPEPTCCIAGRRHSSPGNQNPYLIYKRDEPRIARYQCFASSCRGECRVLPLDIFTTMGWREDYVENLRMRSYPVFNLAHVRKRTILVSAKKGVGKSKAFITWLVAMVESNPGVSFCLIGANISLSRKYHQDLVDAGVEGVVLYQEAPPGPITAPRVVVCINSIHRVEATMDIVAMDEMDMVLTNLNSEVMQQRGRVLSCLEAAVHGAKVVIGMDANIDCARVLEYLFMARPDGVLHTIRNRGLYPAARRATIRVFPQASGSLECIGAAILDVLDRVARGTKVVCPSTSKRFVKLLEHHFNLDNPPAESDRRGIFLHADKKSKADEDFFQKAMAEPDTYLEADCVAFSPKLGPGVSKEKPHAEETVAFALNGLAGPTVETLLQQHARFRTITDSTIYYKQVFSAAVDLPRSTEAVFRAIERDDRQIIKMLGDAAGFQFLRRSPGICDRSSASSVLYANNILAKVESYMEYVPKLKADLEKQGYVVTIEHIEPKGTPGRPPPEVPLGFDADPELLDAEEWRAKYIISSEQYEIMCERNEELTPKEQLQEYLYDMVTKEYKVDPNRVDHGFYVRYCADTDDAQATKEAHANYLRFIEHRFDTLVGDLDQTLSQARVEGVVQEYVQEVREPRHRVPFAVRVLAFLVDCAEDELDHKSARWEVSEDRVQAAYATHVGPTKERLETVFTLYGFKQQTSRPSKAAEGKVNKRTTQKRNAVANVLRAGLGIELTKCAKKSGGKFKTPHTLAPAVYQDLHERYGWFSPSERRVADPEECMIRV